MACENLRLSSLRRAARGLTGALAAALGLALAVGPAEAADAGRRLVLVTLDGLSWTEVFRGANPERAADKAFTEEAGLIRRQFLDTADPPRALTPFLHEVAARQGVLIGDRDHGSCLAIANANGFSYAGYNELLTGRPDPAIVSNAHGPNRNVTFLEWLNRRPDFKGRVEVVASWEVFGDIVNAARSGLRVNAGWTGGEGPGAPADVVALQRAAPHLWPSARLDGFTQWWAMQALKTRKPRVLYIAYDETDDFAHDGHYDQTLWAAHRADGFLAEIWRTLQADPAYAGKTTMIITTDHGRGLKGGDSWRNHGPMVTGADETWFAAIGPDVEPGRKPAGACASSSQVAATALSALGLDWKAFDPGAAAPLDILRRR
jgi:hypothetical protein